MKDIETQPADIGYTFVTSFRRALYFMLYISGYVLLSATVFSIMTPREELVMAIVDGSAVSILKYGPLMMVAGALTHAIAQSAIEAYRAKVWSQWFSSAKLKY